MSRTILTNIFTGILVILMLSAFSQDKKSKSKTPVMKDEEAIKAVIAKETQSFFEVNQKAWASCWAPVSYAFWSFADTTDVNSFSGWENIYSGFDNYFKTSQSSTAKITREWHDIRVYGNAAYVRFTQLVKDDNIRRPSQAEVRVLERINEEWKIVCVNVIAIQKTNTPMR